MAERQRTVSKNARADIEKKTRTVFGTHEGHVLTPQENVFIDKYIELGSAKKAVLAAYPEIAESKASDKGQYLLDKDYIIHEINYRMEMARDEGIADAQEIMRYFTAVMRGEVKDQFGLDASLGERTKAAQELAKRQIDLPQKLKESEKPTEVKVVLDWARH